MNKSKVIKITNEYELAPNKKYGQNFLIDNLFIEKIISVLDIKESDNVLEIGPGLGALSEELSKLTKSLTLFEIDSGFVKYLTDLFNEDEHVEILHGDFLKKSEDKKYTKVVSNLPYYCASEILFIIAQQFTAENVFVMVQKEMAERIVAGAGDKNYGAMTVNLGFYFDARILFDVPGNVFYPKPEVVSSFLKLKRRTPVLIEQNEIKLFHDIVKSAFWGRRKTLLKALTDSPHLDSKREHVREVLNACEIEPSIRGENLSLNEFIKISEMWNSI